MDTQIDSSLLLAQSNSTMQQRLDSIKMHTPRLAQLRRSGMFMVVHALVRGTKKTNSAIDSRR